MRNLKDIKARAFPRTAPERRADCFSVPLHRRALARVPEIPRDCPRLPESGPTSGRARSESTRAASAPRRASIASPVPPPEPAQRAVAPHGRILGFQPAVEAAVEGRRTRTRTPRCALLSCPSWSRGALNPRPREDGLPRRPTSHPRGPATSSRAETRQEAWRSPQDRPRPRSSSATVALPALEALACTARPPRPPVVGPHSQGEDELHRARQGDAPEIARDRSRDCAEIALEITL